MENSDSVGSVRLPRCRIEQEAYCANGCVVSAGGASYFSPRIWTEGLGMSVGGGIGVPLRDSRALLSIDLDEGV